MERLKRAILRRLPDNGGPLPVCGRFYRDRVWIGYETLESVYPPWFVRCCRAEAWVWTTVWRLCGGRV